MTARLSSSSRRDLLRLASTGVIGYSLSGWFGTGRRGGSTRAVAGLASSCG